MESQLNKNPIPPPLHDQPFAYPAIQIQHAIRLLRETCALQHLALNAEQSYVQWLGRYASFFKTRNLKTLETAEQKTEAFLTSLALSDVSASTQNQAFNALLFVYRSGLQPLAFSLFVEPSLRSQSAALSRAAATFPFIVAAHRQIAALSALPARRYVFL